MLSTDTTITDTRPAYDPGGLIRHSLDMTQSVDAQSGPEDAVLAWLVRLPDDIDPATAAAELLQDYRPSTGVDAFASRLFELLEEIRRFPRTRLGSMVASRQGGRRGRSHGRV